MFEKFYSSYRNIISNIAIIGYQENDIIKRGFNLDKKLELSCLFSYPINDENSYNEITYDMMFPDGNHTNECPKFFSLFLTDEKGSHSYLYCLKFPEKYIIDNENTKIEINVPLVICIKSEKSDLEPFRQLLTSINQIIVNENFDYNSKIVNNYKKVELMNILYFIFSLPHTPSHSLVRLKLNNDLCDVEDEIDFYFSSNCEIPCNKNDTDINLLFCFLDQSIIIKVIIALLFEKQIIFRASQAYILHLIIPTFLKLIFPFKWLSSCITILTKDKIEYLDAPGAYIYGILSNTIEIKEIMENYPGRIIVNCDTNEIFGENSTDPFVAPKKNLKDDNESLKKSKKKKDKEQFDNMNGGIRQGKNIFFVDKSYIYQYDPEKNGKGKRLKFDEKNNIIIDTQKSQFLINKANDIIKSDELKWLRKNIQLVRNPEIFEIENINKKKNIFEQNLNDFEESPILPNRSFSYNIQNILMYFYLKKISDEKSEFMDYFKDINLYLNYLEDKKYQNNSNKRIIENIKETINDQKSIDNCFIIEYNLKPFCAVSMIEQLDKRMIGMKIDIKSSFNSVNSANDNNSVINDDEKDKKDKYNIYNNLKNILVDYCLVLGINTEKAKNETFNIDNNKSQNLSINSLNKSRIKHFKNHKGHIKSNSLLQFTFNQNPNFNLAGINKFSKNYFKFYGKNGFLRFLNDLDIFMKEEGKEYDDIIYKMKIYHQLINIYKNLDNIFKNPNEENSEEIKINIDVVDEDFNEVEENDRTTFNLINNISANNNEKNSINNNNSVGSPLNEENIIINIENKNILEELRNFNSIRKTKNTLGMSMITEKEEENNESFIERTTTKKYSLKSNNEDLGNIILNNIKMDENNEDNLNKENILVFPDFENKKEKEYSDFINQFQFNNNINNDKKKKYYSAQYYLFLAYYLEEIKSDNNILEKFNKDIYNSLGVQININKYIIKLYKESYNNSGEKHRDFSYYDFYSFLKNLDNETFSKIGNNINEENNINRELYEIYNEVKKQKKITDYKNPLINSDRDNSNIIDFDRGITIGGIGNNKNTVYDIYSPNDSFRPESYNPNYISSQGISNKSSIIIPNYPSSFSHSYLQENNCLKVNVINSSPLFKTKFKPKSVNLINEFCSLLMNCFPSKEDIQTKNNHQILNEVFMKTNVQSIRELLGELSNLKLSIFNNEKEKICFWLNCFNFLSLYSIFYLKLNISEKEIWKNFFHNIKYNIGGFNFSFEDMLYILFQKNVFIRNQDYTPREYVKKNIINLSQDKNALKKVNPFLLFLPNKEFFRPIIYEENNIESDLEKRCTNYFLCNLSIDENETLKISELIFIFEPDFLGKGLKKYKDFLDKKLYKLIKHKKYKKRVIKHVKWEMCFDYLHEDAFMEI